MRDKLQILAKLPAFQLLPAELAQLVVNSFSPVTYSFGSSVVSEGDGLFALYRSSVTLRD